MKYPKTINITENLFWRQFYTPETLGDKFKKHWWQASLCIFSIKLIIISFSLWGITKGLYYANDRLIEELIESKGLVEEKNLELARVLSIQEGNPTDIVQIAKVVQEILNTAHGDQRKFLEKTIVAAIYMQNRKGIPASALIGQAIYESGYGSSELAEKHNNFFGIKALDSKWKGEVVMMTTKDYDKTVTHQQPFRKYETVEDGFMGYYEFLKNNKRYDKAWDKTSGKEFVSTLARAGYCPDRQYTYDVNKIIDRHKLYLLESILNKKKNNKQAFIKIGDLKL